MAGVGGGLATGRAALARGDWRAARQALAGSRSPAGLTALSDALWWLGETTEAVGAREAAYRVQRAQGDVAGAAQIAAWLAVEYHVSLGDRPASSGWFTIASELSRLDEGAAGRGWLQLARSIRTERPDAKKRSASRALSIATAQSDAGLEARARAELGYALVALGDVEAGIGQLDAAMVTASAGRDLRVVGDVACSIMSTGELLGTLDSFERWTGVIMRAMTELGHPDLMSFCGACCGELFAATGRWDEAESELTRSIDALARSGLESRCVHPVVRLAALDVRRGRLEQAEEALLPYLHLSEAAHPLAMLSMARGNTDRATEIAERRIAQIGSDHLAALPFLVILCETRSGRGDLEGARVAADSVEAVAVRSGLDRALGAAAWCRGLIALAAGETEAAMASLESSIRAYEACGEVHHAAVARARLGESMSETHPDAGVAHMRQALVDLDRIGATADADRLAARLRALGYRGRTGRRGADRLTGRERDVLALVGQGLRNDAIAERLYISPKTAANHVSNILLKLGVSSRTEAARVGGIPPPPGG